MDEILHKICELVVEVNEQPATRERACLLTKLDEARHWAVDMKHRQSGVPAHEPLPPQYGVSQS